MKIKIIFVACFCLVNSLFSQIQINGKILDSNSKKALAGANILVKGTDEGTTSDENGFFSISTTNDTLLISYIGYQEVKLSKLIDQGYYEVSMSANNAIDLITISATAPKLSLRTPEAVTLLSKADISRLQEISPVTILNQIPGVYMQSGALNTNRITIRGIGNRSSFSTAKIRAYLDEIPLTNGVGETTVEDIDLSFIENIQVWKGPTASNFGAALGGVIHLQSPGNYAQQSQLQLQTEFGEYGFNRQVLNASYINEDQQVQLYTNYNRTHSDGYRDNNEYDREGFSILGKIGSGDRHRSTILVNYTDVLAFIPSGLNEDDFINNPRNAAFTWGRVMGFEDYQRVIAGLSHTYDWLQKADGKVLSSTLSLFGSYRDNYESRPFNILRENSWSGGTRFTLDYRKGANRRQPNAQIGVEWYSENYQWTTNATDLGALRELLSDNLELRTYYNLFATVDIELPGRWYAKAGVNFNQTSYELSDFFLTDDDDLSGDYSFDAILSPRLSLGYQLNPNISFFTTVSHGFSAPTLEETLNPDGSRNPEIQPERGWNFELGSRGAHINGKLHYDLAIYSMRIQDLLVARRTGLDQFIGINAGSTTHNGLELSIRYDWLQGANQLSTQLGYNYSDYTFDEFLDGENDFSGNELTGAPPHALNFWLDYRSPLGLYSNLTFNYVDAFPMRDDNSIYSEAYSVVNLKVGWSKAIGKKLNLDAYLGVNNVLDEFYASQILINAGSFGGSAPRYYYPALPRNVFGGIKLAWILEN